MKAPLLCAAVAAAGLVLVPQPASGSGGPGPTFSNPLAITNAFHPFPAPGTVAAKSMVDHEGVLEVSTFLLRTRTIPWKGQAVECRILLEQELEHGVLMESAENYFAQADDGSVFYFGELVEIHEEGADSVNEGSWLVGGPTLPSDPLRTATARNPSLFMPSAPELGDVWWPESLPPKVLERAEVIGVGQDVETVVGVHADCITVRLSERLGDELELKYFAPGQGLVYEQERDGWKELVASDL